MTPGYDLGGYAHIESWLWHSITNKAGNTRLSFKTASLQFLYLKFITD